MMNSRRVSWSVTTTTLALTIALAWSGTGQARAQTLYDGRAYCAYVNVPAVGLNQYVVDTGHLPSSGGSKSASLASINLPGVLSATLLSAHTSGSGGVASSAASVSNVVALGSIPTATLTATLIQATSKATASGTSGSTTIVGLTLGGQPITVTGAPNQKIVVGPITLIINEQAAVNNSATHAISVNALDLKVSGVGQVIVSHAESSIHACFDYTTGLGWCPSGGCVNTFTFNAGFHKGQLQPTVALTYNDYGAAVTVVATDISSYSVVNAVTREFMGSASINGVAGTYDVTVTDNDATGGGPATFSITLSTGYAFSGPLSGGNIEIFSNCH